MTPQPSFILQIAIFVYKIAVHVWTQWQSLMVLLTILSSLLQDQGGGDVPNKKFKKGKPSRWKGKQKQQQQNGKGNQSTASDNSKGKKKKPRIMWSCMIQWSGFEF